MTCVNIVDHRNHNTNTKCDAVVETVAEKPRRRPKKTDVLDPNVFPVNDIQYYRKTTVAKVLAAATHCDEDVTVWLYDEGSISTEEVKECQK